MRDRNKIILITVIVVCVFLSIVGISYLVQRSRDKALAKELRAEFDAWLASLPRVPDSVGSNPAVPLPSLMARV